VKQSKLAFFILFFYFIIFNAPSRKGEEGIKSGNTQSGEEAINRYEKTKRNREKQNNKQRNKK
jgi:hypothetical protein